MTKKIAFIFPGQGSQTLGMLAEFAKDYSLIQETFMEASHVLKFDLWELCSRRSRVCTQSNGKYPTGFVDSKRGFMACLEATAWY